MKEHMKANWFIGILCWSGLISCTEDAVLPSAGPGTVPMGVHVSTRTPSKAPVLSDNIPAGNAIGVALRTEAGTPYDGCDFDNVCYTATDTDPQTWQAADGQEIRLSSTVGKAYAYFPYRPDVADPSAIPVRASEQQDVMWATPVSGLDVLHTESEFILQHLLSIVRIKVQRGTYSKTGQLQQVTVQGPSIGNTGSLNLFTGALSVATKDEALSLDTELSIDESIATDVLVLPVSGAGTMQISLSMDGATYAVDIPNVQLTAGKIHTYVLTFSIVGLELTAISVTDWGTPVDGGSHLVDMAQPVESIPLAADGYFNLGYAASDDLIFELKAQPGSTVDMCPFGSRYAANNQQCFVMISGSGSAEDTNRYWRFGVEKQQYIYKLETCTANSIYWMKFAVNGYALDTNGSLTGWSTTAGTTYSATARPLYLGALNDNGYPKQFFNGNIFYLKVYQKTGDTEVLIHHYVPFDTTTLYDQATGKLLQKTNKS